MGVLGVKPAYEDVDAGGFLAFSLALLKTESCPTYLKGIDMALFRKKPVVIEATQWFKMGDHPAVIRHPNAQADNEGYGWVTTLEGGHVVTPGDWIITGVKGEHYPCKPDIFEATYEAA